MTSSGFHALGDHLLEVRDESPCGVVIVLVEHPLHDLFPSTLDPVVNLLMAREFEARPADLQKEHLHPKRLDPKWLRNDNESFP